MSILSTLLIDCSWLSDSVAVHLYKASGVPHSFTYHLSSDICILKLWLSYHLRPVVLLYIAFFSDEPSDIVSHVAVLPLVTLIPKSTLQYPYASRATLMRLSTVPGAFVLSLINR
jgi:hypothetical protein